MTIAQLWDAYKASGSPELRNKLIEHYSSMVGAIAGQIARQYPIQGVEAEDLFSYGIEALVDAIERFDPSLGWRFETYAMGRVKGGVVDALRAEDWVPSRVRRDAVAIQRGTAHLSTLLHRAPTEAELAQHLGVSVEQLHRMTQDATEAHALYIEEMSYLVADNGSSGRLVGRDALLPSSDISPEDATALKEMQDHLLAGIAALTEQHRVVLALVHREELPFETIGALLGIGPTRVSQLHSAAVLSLRDSMEAVPA